jgi:cyclopropane-fatty-acyl-phospholipid synthase
MNKFSEQSNLISNQAQALVQLEPGQTLRAARAIIQLLFGSSLQRDFAVRYWDGSLEQPNQTRATFTLVLNRPGALRRMFWLPSELAVGEAFVREDFDLEGDFEAAAGLADIIALRFQSPGVVLRLGKLMNHLPKDDWLPDQSAPRAKPSSSRALHSKERDAETVRFHYDLGNDFYALWLDQRMVYSCGYFPTGTESLEAAQTAKLEHICRKLRLKADERLLDIGCGWGGLVIYAAQHYRVQATGITLSEAQAALARERVKAAGLENRVQIKVCDYRDFLGETFDKIVSIGMFEHVGRAKLGVYFNQAYRLLKPGGLFLNHGIVVVAPNILPGLAARVTSVFWRSNSFMQRYVFPDGELVRPYEALRSAENAGFETRDVESLREHYPLTLRHWRRRLEAQHEQAVQLVGKATYRTWRFYMGCVAWAFNAGRIGVSQMLFCKQLPDGSSNLPFNRADVYQTRLEHD